jgi:hypothetical protein
VSFSILSLHRRRSVFPSERERFPLLDNVGRMKSSRRIQNTETNSIRLIELGSLAQSEPLFEFRRLDTAPFFEFGRRRTALRNNDTLFSTTLEASLKLFFNDASSFFK